MSDNFNDNAAPWEGIGENYIVKIKTNDNPTKVDLLDHLDDHYWTVLWEHLIIVLQYYELEEYMYGNLKHPDNPIQAENWDHNDRFTCSIIINNVNVVQVTHITHCKTSHQMWRNLEDIHESKGHTTAITINRNPFHTIAEEGSNILEHLTKMKEYVECINMIGDEDFLITDCFFKVILISSLPPLWDMFTDPYLGGWKGVVETNLKKLMSSHIMPQRGALVRHVQQVSRQRENEPGLGTQLGDEKIDSVSHRSM